MNNEKDKLDDLFRKGLEDPVDPSYREADWESLQQMLDGQKKRRGIVYWLPVLSGVAALLLLFLGWWLLRPKANQPSNAPQIVVRHKAHMPVEKIEKPAIQPDHKQAAPDITGYAKNSRQTNGNMGDKKTAIASAPNIRQVNAANGHGVQIDTLNSRFAGTLMAMSEKPAIEQNTIAYRVDATDVPRPLIDRIKAGDDTKNYRNKVKIKPAFRPQFALTVLAAPDLNGVGSFQQGKLGTNFGLSFSAGVSRKFTITTGVVYSDKPYLTGFANYHTGYKFPTAPVNVSADCRMLDIPLNINYQVYRKNRNTISFGTGLSSYVMMDQKYEFNYADPYTFGPKKFDVAGNDKYLFEILNLTAAYQHQLNPKVGLTIQPYFKVPLANIGYSQVRLQTAGVSFGLSWNLNSISKN